MVPVTRVMACEKDDGWHVMFNRQLVQLRATSLVLVELVCWQRAKNKPPQQSNEAHRVPGFGGYGIYAGQSVETSSWVTASSQGNYRRSRGKGKVSAGWGRLTGAERAVGVG